MTKPQEIKLRKKLQDFHKIIQQAEIEREDDSKFDSTGSRNLNKQFTSVNTKYKRLKSTIWQIYDEEDQEESNHMMSNLKNRQIENTEKHSGVNQYNLMFVKLSINLDKDKFLDYQIESLHTENEFKVESEEYLIFQCLFKNNLPKYTYDMFINIC